MVTATGARGAVVRAITDDWGLKLLALGMSVALFSLVHGDVDAQRSIYVDVVALLPPPESGKMLVSEVPAQVKVTLRGSRSKLSGLSRDDLSPLQLDLRSATNGPFYIDASVLDVGSGIRVTELNPSAFSLTWAATAEKRVAVQVQLDGAPHKGTQVGTVEVVPPYVTLRGPEGVLQTLSTLSTEPVSLTGLIAGRHTRRVPLQPLPQHVTVLEESSVEAVVPVVPVVAERTLRRLEVATVGETVVTVRPEVVSMRLRGPEDALDEIDPRAIVPYIDASLAPASGTGAVDVQVRGLPAGVEVAEIIPASVLVGLKGKP
jgi:YbbR domain-containing protein